ncbi:DUF308 domain-containing protein [uncultured Caulobacter sp.]|uniref:HdeD family acid-resistance protein n=1 Tax=uncultured Caulobacter sp. TaxID=158749 RepID=UPI0026088F8E|nr:DUF308 domain-containing protein [uncultured Caulobacter sp.]
MTKKRASIGPARRIAAKSRRHRRALTGLGGALIVAGLTAVALPHVAPLLIGAAAGWLLWLFGAAMLLVSLLIATGKSLWGGIVASLAAVVAGAFLFFHHEVGLMAATLLIAAVLILDGASELVLALDLRPARVWRWVLASSIASGLAGVAVAGAGRARDLTAIFLGLALASTGAALISLGSRRAGRGLASAVQAGGPRTSPRTPST